MSTRDSRSVVLPILVFAGLLAALVVLFEGRYRHLTAVNAQLTRIQDRQSSLRELRLFVSEAEASQRGFLLSGDAAHLELMRSALPRIGAILRDLARAYARDGAADEADVAAVEGLAVERLQQLEHDLRRYREEGTAGAEQSVPAEGALQTSSALRDAVRTLDVAESDRLVNVLAQWHEDLRTTRWAMGGVTLLNGVLLAWLGAFLFREMRRKSRESSELQRLVNARTAELATLSSHLQDIAEREKQALARELHDALGGLLIATKMDVAWIRRRLRAADQELERRIERIQSALDRGVDVKRRIVENLRPTLLDSMGLFVALRWQFAETCRRAGLECTENLPAEEVDVSGEASIALFRVAQESFANILKHSHATAAELEVTLGEGTLVLSVRDNGRGFTQDEGALGLSHGLSGMRHRVQGLGGRWRALPRERGGTEIRVEVPLANILAARDAADSQTTPRRAIGARHSEPAAG